MAINRKKLRLMLQQHLAEQVDYGRSLWTLLSLALWERKHYRPRLSLDCPQLKSLMAGRSYVQQAEKVAY
jgi:hypothetical protein